MEDQLQPYSFTPLFELVLFSQLNKKQIKKEFNIMSRFFKNNLEEFYKTIETAKELYSTQEDSSALLEQLDKIMASDDPVNSYFKFNNAMLLDDFTKIYKQLRDYMPIEKLKEKDTIGTVLYYSINSELLEEIESTPVGQKLSTGEVNTGSLLIVEKVSLKTRDFLQQYAMLYN